MYVFNDNYTLFINVVVAQILKKLRSYHIQKKTQLMDLFSGLLLIDLYTFYFLINL